MGASKNAKKIKDLIVKVEMIKVDENDVKKWIFKGLKYMEGKRREIH